MRICFDGQGLIGNLTGAGKAFRFLLRQLHQDFPGHDYCLVTPSDRTQWRLPRQMSWEQIQFPWQAVRLGADLLHSPVGAAAPVLRNRRLIMTIHDIAPTRHPEYLPHTRSRWYWGRWVPLTARFADCVIVPSASTKRDLMELAGVPADRVRVIPLGVTLDRTNHLTADMIDKVRSVYGLHQRYVLYVGTIDRRKDYRTMLEALFCLDPDVQLVVAGTVIAGRTDFGALIEELGVRSRVRVLGYVPETDLPVLYREAVAFVYPSFYEGFGLPVLEAMACGTPVITYAVTSLPEVVGDAGILLAPPVSPHALADQIARLLRDQSLRAELSGRGIERAKRFDWKTAARLTHEAYGALAG